MQFFQHSLLCKSFMHVYVKNPEFMHVCSVCAPLKTSFNILMENLVRFTPHSLCGCTTLDTVQVVSGFGHQFLCIHENIVRGFFNRARWSMYTCGQSRVITYATVSTEGIPVRDNATVIIWHSVQGAFK